MGLWVNQNVDENTQETFTLYAWLTDARRLRTRDVSALNVNGPWQRQREWVSGWRKKLMMNWVISARAIALTARRETARRDSLSLSLRRTIALSVHLRWSPAYDVVDTQRINRRSSVVDRADGPDPPIKFSPPAVAPWCLLFVLITAAWRLKGERDYLIAVKGERAEICLSPGGQPLSSSPIIRSVAPRPAPLHDGDRSGNCDDSSRAFYLSRRRFVPQPREWWRLHLTGKVWLRNSIL